MDKILDEKVPFSDKGEIIKSLGIYELRGLARVLGVKSPTTKKREELVENVLKIIENADEITLAEIEKRGRPFKSLTSVQNIIEAISTPPVIEKEKFNKFSTFEELLVFNQEMPAFTLQSSDIFRSSGVVRKTKVCAYFVDCACSRIVFLSHDQVFKYNLDTGDFVDCAVFEINNGDKCYVKKINKINGKDAEEVRTETFSEYTQVLPIQKNFNGKNVCEGGRNIFFSNVPLYLNKNALDLFESYSDCKRVFLGVNICFEDKNLMVNKNIFTLTSNYEGKISDGFDKIIDTINFVEKLKEQNEEVFLFVSDFVNVLNVLDAYYQDDEMELFGHKDKSVVIAKKLISLAMAKNNNRNITSVFICNKLDLEDQFIKNELVKVANVIE